MKITDAPNFIAFVKLYVVSYSRTLRKYIFENRIVSNWNSLLDNVITSKLVFLKTDLINCGEIKHAILIIQLT